MSKFNFNIDVEDNERQNSLSKSKYNSITQKKLIEYKDYIVDLGLPSKTLWCKYNLGCNFKLLHNNPENSKAEDWYGDIYMWGELKSTNDFGEEIYKFNKAFTYTSSEGFSQTLYKITKYNDKDNLTQLLSEDDAAYQNLHIENCKFYMPTKEQIEELLGYTTINFLKKYIVNGTEIEGLFGYEFISKLNKNKLFIPAQSFNNNDNRIISWLWSSTLSIDQKKAYALVYYSHDKYVIDSVPRYYPLWIRPIINSK